MKSFILTFSLMSFAQLAIANEVYTFEHIASVKTTKIECTEPSYIAPDECSNPEYVCGEIPGMLSSPAPMYQACREINLNIGVLVDSTKTKALDIACISNLANISGFGLEPKVAVYKIYDYDAATGTISKKAKKIPLQTKSETHCQNEKNELIDSAALSFDLIIQDDQIRVEYLSSPKQTLE